MPPSTAELEREAGAAPAEEPEAPPVEANGTDPNTSDEDGDGTDGGYPEASSKSALELEIAGAEQLTMSGIGGKAPTASSIRLVGGKVGLKDRQYKKGELVKLEIEARIVEVALVDKLDSNTGGVDSCERRHKARIVGVVELEPDTEQEG